MPQQCCAYCLFHPGLTCTAFTACAACAPAGPYRNPVDGERAAWDLALVRLNRTFGAVTANSSGAAVTSTVTGWLGVTAACADSAAWGLVTAGYPASNGDMLGGCISTQCSVPIGTPVQPSNSGPLPASSSSLPQGVSNSCDSQLLHHMCDATTGQSGSPMWGVVGFKEAGAVTPAPAEWSQGGTDWMTWLGPSQPNSPPPSPPEAADSPETNEPQDRQFAVLERKKRRGVLGMEGRAGGRRGLRELGARDDDESVTAAHSVHTGVTAKAEGREADEDVVGPFVRAVLVGEIGTANLAARITPDVLRALNQWLQQEAGKAK